jgi:hypothetical protein
MICLEDQRCSECFQNRLLSNLETAFPGLDLSPATVLGTGATNLRGVVPPQYCDSCIQQSTLTNVLCRCSNGKSIDLRKLRIGVEVSEDQEE